MQCYSKESSKTREAAVPEKVRKFLPLCLGGTALVIVAIKIFAIPVSTIATLGIFLLCPLMHIFMMKDHNHK